ncbi:MAG: hypothetical protein M3Q49_00320 [Actinomycetota bacterium]|nr:hypothetical protein [Actinomycetota bacterium]MDP9484238.1 hypothetical protein [Actinomycetota bacterium]
MATNGKVTPLILGLALVLALAAFAAAFAPAARAQEGEARGAVDERFPVAFDVEHPCTGEALFVEGTMHVVGHATEDAAGGLHFFGHSNLQGKATSASGARYVLVSGGNNPLLIRSGALQTLASHERFVRQGEGAGADDFSTSWVFHLTVDAEVNIDLVVDKFVSECG